MNKKAVKLEQICRTHLEQDWDGREFSSPQTRTVEDPAVYEIIELTNCVSIPIYRDNEQQHLTIGDQLTRDEVEGVLVKRADA